MNLSLLIIKYTNSLQDCTYKGFKLNKLNDFGIFLFFTLDLASRIKLSIEFIFLNEKLGIECGCMSVKFS